MSPAIRQPWLRSTMMAIESPTAARVAATAASPSSRRRGSMRIFSARKPSSRRRSADSARSPAGQQHRRTRRRPGWPSERAAEQRRDRQPGDLADDVPEGHLERPVAAGVEVDRLERPDVPRDGQRVLADEQVLERLEAVHRVARPDADDALVGLDPHDRDREASSAARDPRPPGTAGRAGRRSRWRRIAVIFIGSRSIAHGAQAHGQQPRQRYRRPSRCGTFAYPRRSAPEQEPVADDRPHHPPSRRRRVRARHEALRRAGGQARRRRRRRARSTTSRCVVPAGKICVLVGPVRAAARRPRSRWSTG